MKKMRRGVKALLILAPLISLLLMTAVIVALAAEVQNQLAALQQLSVGATILQCEGTYDDKTLNLHIWSEANEETVATEDPAGADAGQLAVEWAKGIAEQHRYQYVRGGSICPICHPGKSKGWMCISFVSAAYAHGAGVPANIHRSSTKYCSNLGQGSPSDVGTLSINKDPDAIYRKWVERNGDEWQMVTHTKSLKSGHVDEALLQPGDVLLHYNGNGMCEHMSMYGGNGYYVDCESGSVNGPIWHKYTGSYNSKRVRIALRYTGSGDGTGAAGTQFAAQDDAKTLRTIKPGTGVRYSVSGPSGHGVAQSFAAVGDKFVVAFTPGPETKTKGTVRLLDSDGNYLSQSSGDVCHANGSCLGGDDTVFIGGSLKDGQRDKVLKYKVKDKKITADGSTNLPIGASALAYDKDTNNYILSIGGTMVVYDKEFKKVTTVSRSMHDKYYQDIGAGGGYIFACHTKIKGGEKDGKNYIDVYSESAGYYCGTYFINYGELESADVVNGELVILVHIKGTSNNYIQYTGITMRSAGIATTKIDFRVTATKSRIGNRWQLSKGDIYAGSEKGSLQAEAVVSDGLFSVDGMLFGGKFGLKGTASRGVLSGSGMLEKKLEKQTDQDNLMQGRATYVGVDDTDTPHSDAILAQTKKWSNSHNPFWNGYGGLCETWTSKIYGDAGIKYSGACCAYMHCVEQANKEGKIPKGALIYSGRKRDGSMYENGHRESAFDDVCGHWAGHIAIYVGNGLVAGSQDPYYMSVDSWIDLFGYGGWSLQ